MSLNHLSKTERCALDSFVSGVRSSQHDNIVSMHLFGSRARGEGTENSDLDVLVIVKTVNTRIKDSIWDMANDIFLDTWINISPLVMTFEDFQKLVDRERLIAADINRDGIQL